MKIRSQRFTLFLVVWLTGFSFFIGNAQNYFRPPGSADFTHLSLPGRTESRAGDAGETASRLVAGQAVDAISGRLFSPTAFLRPLASAELLAISPGYASPIFCRFESGLEKSTRLPIRLRVGSLADCDRLEGRK